MARKPMSSDLQTILRQGFTVRELAVAFYMTHETVERRIANCRPAGTRDGDKLYRMRDAAQWLAALPADAISRVVRMNPMDLPAVLKKEYWQGQKARMEVMELEGEIWRTDDVAAFVGESFQAIRMQIVLMRDGLERNTELTGRQKDVLEEMIDGVLQKVTESLQTTFKEKLNGRVGSSPRNDLGGGSESAPSDIDPAADL